MELMKITVTALYAGLLGLLLLALSIRVSLTRARTGLSFFHGDNEELYRAIRAQGNFVEYVPIALILIALVEANGAAAWGVHTLGAVLLASRLIHPFGLASSNPRAMPRLIGTTLTWIVIPVAAAVAIYQFATG